MKFGNYNKMKALQTVKVNPTLKNGCLGNCNTSMIKMGLCKCHRSKKNANTGLAIFFKFQFWMTVALFLCLASFVTHVSFILGVSIILGVWIYFNYFKNARQ